MSPQGYARPGCLHLTVDVRLGAAAAAATAAAGVRGVAQALLSGPQAAFWAAQASQVCLPLAARGAAQGVSKVSTPRCPFVHWT